MQRKVSLFYGCRPVSYTHLDVYMRQAAKSEGFSLRDRNVIAVTEAVVARAQGNYAHIDQIAKDVHNKFGDETVGVIFPILSRNRFAICLKGIAKGCKKVILMLSYPSDEVGNHLISEEQLLSLIHIFTKRASLCP